MKLTTQCVLVSLLSLTGARAQAPLVGTSLTLTGPQNTQMIGGVGVAGDGSCPVLSQLTSGFATCYFAATGLYELGYPNGSYSPFARLSDLQHAEASVAAQISGLTQQITALQAQVAMLSAQGVPASQAPSLPSTNPVVDVVLNGGNFEPYGFLQFPLATVNADTASGFNRATSAYTIPSEGYYLVISKVRFSDNLPAGISFGQGAGTQTIDGPNFIWFSTQSDSNSGNTRNGSLNASVVHYNQGDQVKMYGYLDYETLLPMTWAELTIIKLSN